jgi:hypothetical protein
MSLAIHAPRFFPAQSVPVRMHARVTRAKDVRLGMIVAFGFSASVWAVALAYLL